ncbi:MAG: hypothetical protein VYB10_07490 [Actinomycetota bacterium]|nr:hypothetical protein [Acidimicrobiales bacterium]MEE2806923.1 hypothetical protein [Actinomycetota bacterium]
MEVTRLVDGPIVSPRNHRSIGHNIQGPSLIKVPDWITAPLGRYYLYFADHKGSYIRLAYADEITGPWHIHPPGSLHLAESCFVTEPPDVNDDDLATIEQMYMDALGSALPHDIRTEITTPHIASPDVHVDDNNQRITMYFHGLDGLATQLTRVAFSSDGINFTAHTERLSRPYLRVFDYGNIRYGIAMPGQVYRSANGIGAFEEGPTLFERNMRHMALVVRGGTLHVLWTRVGDTPERILLSTIDLKRPWREWSNQGEIEVLRPERSWEGADAPLQPSIRSVAYGYVNQLRDPALYLEDDRTFLLYAVAGESGIGLAEITW